MLQNDTFVFSSTLLKNVTQMQRKRSTEEEEESVTAVQKEIRRKMNLENERQVSGVSL